MVFHSALLAVVERNPEKVDAKVPVERELFWILMSAVDFDASHSERLAMVDMNPLNVDAKVPVASITF